RARVAGVDGETEGGDGAQGQEAVPAVASGADGRGAWARAGRLAAADRADPGCRAAPARGVVTLASARGARFDRIMNDIPNYAALRAHMGEISAMAARKVLTRLDKHCRAFIELSPFLVLAT